MDIEAPVRREVINILGDDFICFEEVEIRSRFKETLRADVIAISRKGCEPNIVLAIEVKQHENYSVGKFKDAIIQAEKYVGGTFNLSDGKGGYHIDAGIVFPAYDWFYPNHVEQRNDDSCFASGVMFLAEKYQVGTIQNSGKYWQIQFGANEFWTQRRGWTGHARTRFPNNSFVVN